MTQSSRDNVLGIISKVSVATFSTTFILPVITLNKQFFICKDFKVTVNRCFNLTKYLLLYINKIFERLLGEKVYSKLDLPDAYLQVKLDQESERHVVSTTYKIFYCYFRLSFKIVSAFAIFLEIIQHILQPVLEAQPKSSAQKTK